MILGESDLNFNCVHLGVRDNLEMRIATPVILKSYRSKALF
jgi:hypothetical protein